LTSVLHVDQYRHRRVDASQLLDRHDRHEEGRPRAAVLVGDLDAHQPELEAGVDQLARDLRLLVHPADERPDPLLREVAHDGAEILFVRVEVGERQADTAHVVWGMS
jgi:hypothetical protein